MEEPEHLEERRLIILQSMNWQEKKKDLPVAVAMQLDDILHNGISDGDILMALLLDTSANEDPQKRIYTYQKILANGNPRHKNELLGLVLDEIETFLKTGKLS